MRTVAAKVRRLANSAIARFGSAERDLIALGIATAAIIMFIGTGSAVGPQVVRSLAGAGVGPNSVLVNALLLNIALIIFGWRRYRQLSIEVKERRLAEEQARALAQTDPLTGLRNRRGFTEAVQRDLAACSSSGKAIAVLMVDLDNFKQINDLHGHTAGDRVLIGCARRIEAIVPQGSTIARIGGDEFACAIEIDSDDEMEIEAVAAQIVRQIANTAPGLPARSEITASVGITRSDIDGGESFDDAERLMEMADQAMYHAKRKGRNGYFWFEQEMADQMRHRTKLEAGIREGIERGEFVPYYEQQIDLATGKLCGFEMLARWNSPEFGLVEPATFIPIAEDIGRIGDLSESLIAIALADAAQWHSSLSLAVNISPLQLRDGWFAQRLLKLLAQHRFPPQRLEIEITESCLHHDIEQVHALLTGLKNQGIRISLDDFGTGYSTLAQLRALPFDRIKIDKSLVMNMDSQADDEAIIRTIKSLGENLGMPVTAEGVHNDAVLAGLRAMGEITGQGYHYGKPVPSDAVLKTLAERDLLAETGADRIEAVARRQGPAPAQAQPAGNSRRSA